MAGDPEPIPEVVARRRSRRAVSWRSWWSWAAQPWRSAPVLFALLGSLALPAMVLAAGAMFEESAADAVTDNVLRGLDADSAGLTLSTEGGLAGDTLLPFDELLTDRLALIDGLGPSARVLITETRSLSHFEADGTPGPSIPKSGVRLFARPGAVESLDVVDGDRATHGVWISQSLAADTGLGTGDEVSIGGGAAAVPIAGVYADLWSDGRPVYWDGVPGQYVPRFLRIFGSTNFELMIVDETLMLELGPVGRVTWHVPLVDPPDTRRDLDALAADYRRLERALVRDEELDVAYRGMASEPDLPIEPVTALHTARSTVLGHVADLRPPIRTSTLGGVVVGVVLSTTGALFLIRRRQGEYRLMAADGDGVVRFFLGAVVQFAVPAVVAAGLGAGGAVALVTVLGPSGRADTGVLPWSQLAVATAASVLVAGAVTGLSAVRLSDALSVEVGRVGRTPLALLAGAAAAMWIEVGRTVGSSSPASAGPLVIAFPFVGIVTGVVAVVVVMRWVLHRLRRTGRRLPLPVFLAWRALTASDAGALLLTAALGLTTGLAVLSSLFVASIDAAIEAKALTLTGGGTRIDRLGPLDEADLPPGTTVIRSQTTSVGDRTVEIVAVDPTTFATVSWAPSFGISPDDLVAGLAADGPDTVPAYLVEGRTLPTSGEFGNFRVFPYRIVGAVGSVPLASAHHATLVVRADVYDAVALARYERGEEPVDEADAIVAETQGEELAFESPMESYGRTVLSSLPADRLMAELEVDEVLARDVSTYSDRIESIDAQAVRWAFDFLRILAAIGALAALGAMTLYLAERRAGRETSAVMSAQMGVSSVTNLFAAVVELVGLVVFALVAGSGAAVVTARRVYPAFEPDPRIPPVTHLTARPGEIALVMIGVVVTVALVAARTQRAAGRAVKAQVLRG